MVISSDMPIVISVKIVKNTGMERIDLIFILLLAVALVLGMILGRSCSATRTANNPSVMSGGDFIGVQYDTIYRDVEILKPIPYEVVVCDTDTVTIADTVEVLRDYYSSRFYNFPFADSLVFGDVSLNISQNKLQSFNMDYKVVERTVYELPKWSWSVGGGIEYDWQNKAMNLEVMGGVGCKKHNVMLGVDLFGGDVSVVYIYKFYKK